VKHRSRSALIALVTFFGLAPLNAGWPRFRGPDGSGASEDGNLPLRWSDNEGVLWKLELPGPGSSSPIVSGGRVFVTCYSGYGTTRGAPGDIEKLRRHVVCVDAAGGKLLWDRPLESKAREARFEGIGIPNHGYASHTPAADGERVYAFLGSGGVVAFDRDGRELWRKEIAPSPATHGFGSASSLVLHGDLVIVPAGIECESIIAFNKRTGDEVWRTPAQGYGAFWGTPVLAAVDDRFELVLSVPGEVWGMNPETGKLRWYAQSFAEQSVCPSVVVAGGVAYAIGGRQRGGAVAVRVGGRGEVTGSHVVWNKGGGSYVTSPVIHDGHLYWITDAGIAVCLKADDGEEVTRQRLEGAGSIYASAFLARRRLYVVTRRSGTFVLEASPKLEVLARNTLESDSSDFNASPAASNGRLFLRSNRFLYCLAQAK
jgi:outer membrane protein assembly factor BamB